MQLCDTVIGCQWGDEGKAKAIDFMASGYDIICRYQGGANAGHTVWDGAKKYIFHLVPSGILHAKTEVLLGNGVYLNLQSLVEEIVGLEAQGIDFSNRFKVSDQAFLVLPYHIALDTLKENNSISKGKEAIGTTRQGIGPCSMDKYGRMGIRLGDLFDTAGLAKKLERSLEEKRWLFEYYRKDLSSEVQQAYRKYFEGEEIEKVLLRQFKKVKQYVANTQVHLQDALRKEKKILFEGAQGSGLDIDFGTYPFVTSSSPTISGVCSGTGIPPKYLKKTVGIFKTYATRVGEGPFPTALDLQEEMELLRERGGEYGSTTGRARRCGWFDLVQARHSVWVNGVSEIFLTKLDVLDKYENIKVCIGYKKGGEVVYNFPTLWDGSELVEPVYETLPGWREKTFGLREYKDLPGAAKAFIQFLERKMGVPVKHISTGPERLQTIKC